jgi:hypothetical protein
MATLGNIRSSVPAKDSHRRSISAPRDPRETRYHHLPRLEVILVGKEKTVILIQRGNSSNIWTELSRID